MITWSGNLNVIHLEMTPGLVTQKQNKDQRKHMANMRARVSQSGGCLLLSEEDGISLYIMYI